MLRMKTKYDKDVDVLLIKIRDENPAYGKDIGGGVIVHYSKDKVSVEIEILDAKRYLIDWVKQALEAKPTPATA